MTDSLGGFEVALPRSHLYVKGEGPKHRRLANDAPFRHKQSDGVDRSVVARSLNDSSPIEVSDGGEIAADRTFPEEVASSMMAAWQAGQPPPEFALDALGKLASQAGTNVEIRFWLTWCALAPAPAQRLDSLEALWMDNIAWPASIRLVIVATALESLLVWWNDFRLADRWLLRLDENSLADELALSPRAVLAAFSCHYYRDLNHPALPAWFASIERAIEQARGGRPDSMLLFAAYFYCLWTGRRSARSRIAHQARQVLEIQAVEIDVPSRIGMQVLVAVEGLCDPDTSATIHGIEHGIALGRESGFVLWEPLLRAPQALIASAIGDGPAARAAAESMQAATSLSGSLDRAYASFVEACVWIAQCRSVAAYRSARRGYRLAERAGSPVGCLYNLVIIVIAAQELGRVRLQERYRDQLFAELDRAQSPWFDALGVTVKLHQHAVERISIDEAFASRALAVLEGQGLVMLPWMPRTRIGEVVALLQPFASGHAATWPSRLLETHRLPPVARLQPVVSVCLLGVPNVQIESSGRSAGNGSGFIRRRKPLELLAVWVAAGRRPIEASALGDRLWPDADGDTSARNLKVTIHRLRDLLGRREAVVWRNGCLSIDESLVWIDVSALGDLLAELEKTPRNKEPMVRRDAFERLVALLRGPLLAGTANPLPWLVAERRLWGNRLKTLAVSGTLANEDQRQALLDCLKTWVD